ncbi:phage portal protein [Candidatus Phycosocius spiralis]|uniref:Portal protein n=1 Tax=Candidatus Phycosocius spiralis TaxID=2815099 RepID=A0ABQ4PX49_9PROT|nr:phage portal protein [Candidatus Phycosocius spiralis]GIU67622.1 portal protein [Candidatus Phycosocius spiralis]
MTPFPFFKRRPKLTLGSGEAKASSPFLAYTSPGRPVWTPRDYGALAREGFQRNAIAYRCVRLVAETAASVPLNLRDGAGQPHPLANLFLQPNPEQSGPELLEAFFGHLQIAGNGWLEMVALDGLPREICVLRPDRVRIIPGVSGWPDGWEHDAGGVKRRIWRDTATGRAPICHLKLFNPADDLYGQSPLEAAAIAVDIHNAGGAWNKALIDNAARPSGALVYRGMPGAERLSEEQFERLKAELTQAHTGASNAGRPLLLEGGLEWTSMSLTPAEMDFVEARRAASRDIALAFGVPPMLLGIPGDSTYSNYKEANLAFWRQTILPLVSKAAACLANWLAPWADVSLTITPDLEAVPALSGEREAFWARLETASFLSVDEKRVLAGFPPLNSNFDQVSS